MIHDVRRQYIIEGILYEERGWAGCQLVSKEWRRPGLGFPDRSRRILGRDFEPFTVKRSGLKFEITWCMRKVHNIPCDDANQMIRGFYAELRG